MIDPIFKIIGLSAVLTTSAFIPQVYKIYKEKNADGISLTMYIIVYWCSSMAFVWNFDRKSQ